MLKIAIVGCGKIADAHAAQIQRIEGCEIVGVCDNEPLMARQLYERFPIKRYFGSLAELLAETRPDVVHITTPPQSHFTIAKQCLDWGCHVYVEKPFALDAAATRQLIAQAADKKLKITVGHDDQFTHVTRRMRALVQSGYLGGGPVHMEGYYSYELGVSEYAGSLLGDKRHWVRGLPGKLLHNVISHGIARIAEFLTTDSPHVLAYGFISPALKALGESEILDELRVIIAEEDGATAYFTFSSQMRPDIRQFRIYGRENGLVLDQDHEMLIRLRGARFRSYLQQFVPPLSMARQYVGGAVTNARLFMARDFHMKAGMKCLIETFYRSVVEDTPEPIPHREIELTATIMDSVFAQLNATMERGRRAGAGA